MGIKTILFLAGLLLGAILSYFAKPIATKTGKEEGNVKIAGLLVCLIFAILLFLGV